MLDLEEIFFVLVALHDTTPQGFVFVHSTEPGISGFLGECVNHYSGATGKEHQMPFPVFFTGSLCSVLLFVISM